MKKLLLLPVLFFVLGIQTSYSGGRIPEGVDCVQPTIDGCEWSPNIFRDVDIDVDDDDIAGSGYVTVPLMYNGQAACNMDDDDLANGTCGDGIRKNMPCVTGMDDDTECPIVGCIGPDCNTNKLAWEVEVFDPQSSHPDPNPCVEIGGKFDFQCSDNVTSIPAGCYYVESPSHGIRCLVEFDTSIEYCNPFLDDDDMTTGSTFEVQLIGKHLYNPASGGRQRGGKNDTNNGVNQTGKAHCLPFLRR